jgi:class 3 adenylate cyclase/pimeloyl-ACP methyl ester carboxylesterase
VDERPITRFAKAPDGVNVAYQVVGEGPLDVVFLTGSVIPVDLLWDEPSFLRFAKRLRGFSRTVWCEARGMGASGGDFRDGLIDEIADADLTAVINAVGCEQVVIVGPAHSGPAAIRYAAAHPGRVSALVLINTYAHYLQADDCPWGVPPAAMDRYVASAAEGWGTGALLEVLAPSRFADEQLRAWWARSERLGQRSDQIAASMRANFTRDVRPLLTSIGVPSLVLHRASNHHIRVGAGRYLAEHIPGATFVELPGDDALFFLDADAMLDEIEEFLTGNRQAPEGEVLTSTILFTDIVASTEQSARLGHRKWTALTDAHDTMVRSILTRQRGYEVKTIGDGFLATFDATTRAVRAAIEIVTQAKNMGLEVRAGVHLGEVEVRTDDVVGLAVSITKRICDLAGPGQVFTSRTVSEVAGGSGVTFNADSEHTLKGVPGTWQLFTATS